MFGLATARRKGFWILLVLVCLIVVSGCGKHRQEAGKSSAKPVATARITTVATRSIPDYAQVPGVVVPVEKVTVASRLTGYIRNLNLHEGQQVRVGDVLFTVSRQEIEDKIRQAEAALKEAQSSLENARVTYKRYRALFRTQAVTPQNFDQVRTDYEVALSRRDGARARLHHAQTQKAYAAVRSPINGIVVQKLRQNGDLTVPGHPVLRLENTEGLELRVALGRPLFDRLDIGQKVRVRIDGKTIAGRVRRKVRAGDPATHTFLVKVALPSDASVESGMFGHLKVPVEPHQGIRIPARALLRRAGIPGVFVLDKNHVAHYRMIRPGPVSDGRIEVLAGLVAGEKVVVSSSRPLDNGDAVRVEGEGS